MSRSSILSGLIQQRDRAKLRKRLDHTSNFPELPPVQQLENWLTTHICSIDISALESYNLTQYLRDTSMIALAPAERLGRLVLYFENNFSFTTEQPRFWLALDRIYKEAIHLDNSSPWLHSTRALCAHNCADELLYVSESKQDWIQSKVRHRMMKVAYTAIFTALELSPDDIDTLYAAGIIQYFDPDKSTEEALTYFNTVLRLQPEHALAIQYRAHSLHDLERWSEASHAYDSIRPEFYVGTRSWIYERLLEQKAYCYFRAGQRKKAIDSFLTLLLRWSHTPSLAENAIGNLLVEAAIGLGDEVLLKGVQELCQREGWTTLLERLSL